MEQVEERGELLNQIRELFDELRVIREITSTDRALRVFQLNYTAYLLGLLDVAIADYYTNFIRGTDGIL